MNMSAGGVSISGSVQRTSDGAIGLDVAVPGAKVGELTTRGSATAGTITLEADHGITTADTVDIYWDGGMRFGVTVGTVSGTAVPISSGTGDDLPAEDADISVAPIAIAEIAITGDDLIILGLQAVAPAAGVLHRCHVDFQDSGGSEVQVELVTNAPQVIDVAGGQTNILAADLITEVWLSTSYTGGLQLRLAALVDVTP